MQQLIQLPLNTTQFEANGTRYTYEEMLSIERYRMFERFRIEVALGSTFEDIRKLLSQNIDYLERFAQGEKVYSEMVTLNYNTLKGMVNVVNKEPFAIWFCTLFFNTPDEDRRRFNEEIMRKKIIDWQEAGIDNSFFISRACSMISGYLKAYEEITQLNLGWGPGENPAAEGDEAAA